MNETTEIHLTSTPKLIDIHGPFVNFRTLYDVHTKNGSSFDIAIANQTQLDNNEIQFQTISNGGTKGEFMYDRNEFQNHFIVLRSDTKSIVTLSYQTVQIPPNPTTLVVQQPDPLPVQEMPIETYIPPSRKNIYETIWFKIFVISILVCIGIYFYRKNKSSESSSIIDNIIPSVEKSDILNIPPAPVSTPAPVVPASPVVTSTPPVIDAKPKFKLIGSNSNIKSTQSVDYETFASRLTKRLNGGGF